MRAERKSNNVLGNYIEVTDIINGQLVRRIYEGYSIADAKAMFKEETQSENINRAL